MYEFDQILDHIWAVLMDARQLAQEAVTDKAESPDAAAVYYHMATDRISHYDLLKKLAQSMVAKAEADHPDDADIMSVVWDHDHPRLANQISEIKVILEQYR